MAHHGHTQKSILEAPRLTPVVVHATTLLTSRGTGKAKLWRRHTLAPAFVGDVERDLLGVTVGTSRKGRKIRRAGR